LLACKMEACRDGAEQLQCISGIEVVCWFWNFNSKVEAY
jgi:hypothetical protein